MCRRKGKGKFDEDPLVGHEWYGQFTSTVHSAAISDDMKISHLKTLVTGKAKAAIAGFAYRGVLYGDALRTLETKLFPFFDASEA